jgi:uncharacterized membrane protein YgcG
MWHIRQIVSITTLILIPLIIVLFLTSIKSKFAYAWNAAITWWGQLYSSVGDADPLLPQTLTPSHDDGDDVGDDDYGGDEGKHTLFALSLTPLDCDSDSETVSIVRSVRGTASTGTGGGGVGDGKTGRGSGGSGGSGGSATH